MTPEPLTGLADRLLNLIERGERAARECAEVYPTEWELSDRGWMAHLTADGPHFLEIVRLDQEQADPGTDLAGALLHFDLHNPDAALRVFAAHRKIVSRYQRLAGRQHKTYALCVKLDALEEVLVDLATAYDVPGAALPAPTTPPAG